MRTIFLLVVSFVLTACSASEIKAPCDYQGHFCGQKYRINH